MPSRNLGTHTSRHVSMVEILFVSMNVVIWGSPAIVGAIRNGICVGRKWSRSRWSSSSFWRRRCFWDSMRIGPALPWTTWFRHTQREKNSFQIRHVIANVHNWPDRVADGCLHMTRCSYWSVAHWPAKRPLSRCCHPIWFWATTKGWRDSG
jgi:hypothetical protein